MSDPKEITTLSGCFLSAFRNLAGPGALLALGAVLMVDRPALGSGLDLVFLATAVANVLVGLLYKPALEPVKEGQGEVQGVSRSTYVIGVVVVSALIWILAHFVLGRHP